MSAPITPTAIHAGTSHGSIDFADRDGVADPGADEIRIVKADGLRGSLGLYEVTVNGKTDLLTRDELEQRNLQPGGGGAHFFGAPPEKPRGDAPEKPANPATPNLPASDAGVVLARRNVSNATLLATRTAEQLRELAKWPQKAHAAWKDLTQMERIAVFENMQKRYGETFAKQFLQFTKSGARNDGAYYGPKLADQTPQRFTERGFKLAQRDSEHDWWVHPSGYSVTVDREREVSKPGAAVAPPVDNRDPDALRREIEDLDQMTRNLETEMDQLQLEMDDPIDYSGQE